MDFHISGFLFSRSLRIAVNFELCWGSVSLLLILANHAVDNRGWWAVFTIMAPTRHSERVVAYGFENEREMEIVMGPGLGLTMI